MVIKSLDINTAGVAPFEWGTYRLIIELSPSTLSVLLWHNTEAKPVAAEVFTNQQLLADDWDAILQQSVLLRFSDAETFFISALNRAMPIPIEVYSPDEAKAQLDLLFGKNSATNFTGGDIIDVYNLMMAWQMPSDWHDILTAHFKVIQFKHLLGVLSSISTKEAQINGSLVVYGQLVWITITQNDLLMIARPIHLQKPEDLSYHLLNTCLHLGISPNDICWQVSGMAALNSPIWEAVAKYFQQVNLKPANCPLPNELPAHYFAHLYPALL